MTTTATVLTDPTTLVALQQIRPHPALHFSTDPPLASVGIVTPHSTGKPMVELITSTRARVPTGLLSSRLAVDPYPYDKLLDRWRPEDVGRFLDGTDSPPTFAETVTRVYHALRPVLETGHYEHKVLACWAVATYFFPLFLAFPRLDLRGEMGSGKSKALSILAACAFNGLHRVNPTPAVLFRLIEPLRPTLCLDEIEDLVRRDKPELLAILNSGYKAGGCVDRCEPDTHKVRSYAVYAPVALAGIEGLNQVTQDRAITLALKKGRDARKLDALVDVQDERFATIRDECYRLALLRWQDVRDLYHKPTLPNWLHGRARELWLPLLVIAHLAEQDGSRGFVDDLLDVAVMQSGERSHLSGEADGILKVLDECLGGAAEVAVSPKELCDDLQAVMGWDYTPKPEMVGRLLTRLGFQKTRGAEGIRYRVTREAAEGLRLRSEGTYTN